MTLDTEDGGALTTALAESLAFRVTGDWATIFVVPLLDLDGDDVLLVLQLKYEAGKGKVELVVVSFRWVLERGPGLLVHLTSRVLPAALAVAGEPGGVPILIFSFFTVVRWFSLKLFYND